jgi:hypothetical protein
MRKKNQIGDYTLPQRGFGFSTPSGAEREGQSTATRDAGGGARADRERHTSPVANTRESAGTASSTAEAPTKKGGNNKAHSITVEAGTALQEGERLQEPGHAMRVNGVRIKQVLMKRQAHSAREQASQAAGGPTGAQRSVGSRHARGEAVQLNR